MTEARLRDRWRSSPVVVILLVATLIVILIGLQAAWNQHVRDENARVLAAAVVKADQRAARADHRDACANLWSDEIHDTLQAARTSTEKLRSADKHWHKRVDAIFQLLIESRTTQVPDSLIDVIVADYQRAKNHLFDAYGHVDQSNALHPYPRLNPKCTLPKKGGTK